MLYSEARSGVAPGRGGAVRNVCRVVLDAAYIQRPAADGGVLDVYMGTGDTGTGQWS